MTDSQELPLDCVSKQMLADAERRGRETAVRRARNLDDMQIIDLAHKREESRPDGGASFTLYVSEIRDLICDALRVASAGKPDEIDAAVPEGAQGADYYYVEEGGSGWTIYWPDRPGYFYLFGHGDEAKIRAKSVCRALNKEHLRWLTTPPQPQDAARDREDAERYRWLREHFRFANDSLRELWFDQTLEPNDSSAQTDLDAAIDAARGAGGGGS